MKRLASLVLATMLVAMLSGYAAVLVGAGAAGGVAAKDWHDRHYQKR
ncbi:MAG TPA: hypothetical protein VJJ02_00585 [Candidatus Paceibacterota bacterium]